jgi:hypothetical protein
VKLRSPISRRTRVNQHVLLASSECGNILLAGSVEVVFELEVSARDGRAGSLALFLADLQDLLSLRMIYNVVALRTKDTNSMKYTQHLLREFYTGEPLSDSICPMPGPQYW